MENIYNNLLKLALEYELLTRDNLEFYDMGVDYPKYFIHFSDDKIGKGTLGINTRYEFNTPIGIYGYPVLDLEELKLSSNFALDRKYAYIFSINGNILYMSNYDDGDYFRDLIKLRDRFNCTSDYIKLAKDNSRNQSPSGWLWNLTRLLSGENVIRWGKILRELGYDAIYDNGSGIIHKNEPLQVVVLNPRVIDHKKTLINEEKSINLKEKIINNILKKMNLFSLMYGDIELSVSKLLDESDISDKANLGYNWIRNTIKLVLEVFYSKAILCDSIYKIYDTDYFSEGVFDNKLKEAILENRNNFSIDNKLIEEFMDKLYKIIVNDLNYKKLINKLHDGHVLYLGILKKRENLV